MCPDGALETRKENCELDSPVAFLTESATQTAVYSNIGMSFLCKYTFYILVFLNRDKLLFY